MTSNTNTTKAYFDRVATLLQGAGHRRATVEASDELLAEWRLEFSTGSIRFNEQGVGEIEAVFEWGDVEIELSITPLGRESHWEVRDVNASGETIRDLAECFRDLHAVTEIGEGIGED